MNGVRLLVLFAAFQLGGELLQAQVADPFPTDPARDFGWQVREGVLEYIVQLTPEKALFMQQHGEENISDMPPELVGRVRRIVFRIGNDILPKSPSKEQIKQTFPLYASPSDVTASLGAGQFSDVESNSVVNVQGSGLPYPSLPNAPNAASGQSGSPARPQSGLPRQPSPMGDSSKSSRSDRFLADSMGSAPNSLAGSNSFPSTSPGPSTLPQTNNPSLLAAGTNKFNSNAPSGNTAGPSYTGPATGGLAGAASNPSGSDNWQGSTNGSSGTGYGGTPNPFSGQSNSGQNYDPRVYNPNAGVSRPSLGGDSSFSQQAPSNWGSAPARTLINPGTAGQGGNSYAGPQAGGWGRDYDPNDGSMNNRFAADPGPLSPGQKAPGYGGSGFGGNGYGGGGYGGGGYAGGRYAGPGYTGSPPARGQPQNQVGQPGRSVSGVDGVPRIASNPNPIGNNTGTDNSENGAVGGGSGVGKTAQSPSDGFSGTGGSNDRSVAHRSSDVWLQIFFLVSLIVNFYLGVLIRKLLTRYRSLLSSVRGQAA